MRKEVLLAVIFGIVLGGIILYGINLANKSVIISESAEKSDTKTAPSPTIIEKSLKVVTPSNHTVTTDKTLSLVGKSLPESNIAIVSESDDIILQASPEGTFSATINLVSGENTIVVTELLENNSTISEKLTIIQTSSLPE